MGKLCIILKLENILRLKNKIRRPGKLLTENFCAKKSLIFFVCLCSFLFWGFDEEEQTPGAVL